LIITDLKPGRLEEIRLSEAGFKFQACPYSIRRITKSYKRPGRLSNVFYRESKEHPF